MTTFGHSGACGDLICALPTIKALGGGVLRIGRREFRLFNWYEKLIPQFESLLTNKDYAQHDYVSEVKEWTGEPVDYNLDDFRLNVRADPSLHLVDCHARCFGLDVDKTVPWLQVKPLKLTGKTDIIVSRSDRFHDGNFDWTPLFPYADRCAFIGFPEEHAAFEKLTGMQISYLEELQGELTHLFLMFARIIAGSKLFIGNSSFHWTLAEALKVNRVMDVYHGYPNCLPQTANGWTGLTDSIIQQCLA
jgi:hypothetical protein